jgi:hypothetical protein
MPSFVWTKMGVESGEALAKIVQRKDNERSSGRGVFWWGIGNSLGPKVREHARAAGGTLPVLFSKMLAPAKIADTSPEKVFRWTRWEDEAGRIHEIPAHVNVISKGSDLKAKHYALVCHSDVPLALVDNERFDPTLCRTPNGRPPGPSQVTALLTGHLTEYKTGSYKISFRATLVAPWAPKLLSPIIVSS